ncbi:hypothetical protein TMCBR3_gp007 [Caulobacter phage TMCBR3]|nr:hypothetical protein TMCBR3_gp007 [Caulobacter phage TMCBR3]
MKSRYAHLAYAACAAAICMAPPTDAGSATGQGEPTKTPEQLAADEAAEAARKAAEEQAAADAQKAKDDEKALADKVAADKLAAAEEKRAAKAKPKEATKTRQQVVADAKAGEREAIRAAASASRAALEVGQGETVYRVKHQYTDKHTGRTHDAGSLVALTDKRHKELREDGGAGVVENEPAPEDAVDESEAARIARQREAEDEADAATHMDEAVEVGGGLAPGAPAVMSTETVPSVLTGGGRRGSQAQ